MSWCLLMLAKYQDIQQKARDEVMSVLGTSEPLTYENLNKLEYCGCVIKETLRYACHQTCIQDLLSQDQERHCEAQDQEQVYQVQY